MVDPILEPLAHETAALLHVGDDAVLSHESAAALWGLARTPSFVALTMIGRHPRGQQGLRLHEVDRLDIRDATSHLGFPVTSPARTLIDCAGNPNLDHLLNEARALKLVTDAELAAAMDRCPRRKGVASLRALLEAERETGFTRSKAERVLKRLVHDGGLDHPIFNSYVEGVEADAYWPGVKLVVEVDGIRFHGHYRAFERDRAKTNKLMAAGYVVLRFTWPQLTARPMAVVATIARTLGRLETARAVKE